MALLLSTFTPSVHHPCRQMEVSQAILFNFRMLSISIARLLQIGICSKQRRDLSISCRCCCCGCCCYCCCITISLCIIFKDNISTSLDSILLRQQHSFDTFSETERTVHSIYEPHRLINATPTETRSTHRNSIRMNTGKVIICWLYQSEHVISDIVSPHAPQIAKRNMNSFVGKWEREKERNQTIPNK